jgi:2-polyprenyl-6-hydroxyphenyl methylase/3-demethylubiquinone-9 3-methyltransferase
MSTVSTEEITKFGKLAPSWWDEKGPMRPLHRMNPLRVGWIDARIAPHSTLLDLGCGAGIAAEAFARRGHTVLGLDASPEAIAAAETHAREHQANGGLHLAYRAADAAELAAEGRTFDVVTALEVIEHTVDQLAFMRLLASLVRPGGRVFVSTLNRTWRSLAVAKIGAEYVARLLPTGTHDWRRFVPPEALASYGREAGLRMDDLTGMAMGALSGDWRPTPDVGINYLAAFVRD